MVFIKEARTHRNEDVEGSNDDSEASKGRRTCVQPTTHPAATFFLFSTYFLSSLETNSQSAAHPLP